MTVCLAGATDSCQDNSRAAAHCGWTCATNESAPDSSCAQLEQLPQPLHTAYLQLRAAQEAFGLPAEISILGVHLQ